MAGKEFRPHCVGFLSHGSLTALVCVGEMQRFGHSTYVTLLAPPAFAYQSDTSNTFCEYKLLPFFLVVSTLRVILYYKLGFISGIF